MPRVALAEMGPALHLVMRRHRLPAVDMEKEALKQPKRAAKKVNQGQGLAHSMAGPEGQSELCSLRNAYLAWLLCMGSIWGGVSAAWRVCVLREEH